MKSPNDGPRPSEADRKNKQTVLVVDDEKDLVDLIAYNLQRNGYDVLTAKSGDAAWKSPHANCQTWCCWTSCFPV